MYSNGRKHVPIVKLYLKLILMMCFYAFITDLSLRLTLYHIAGKFGGLAIYIITPKLKSAKISYSHIYILWQSDISKFKSTNILAIAIWGSTAKFNSRQFFQLYGINVVACSTQTTPTSNLAPGSMLTWNPNYSWHPTTITWLILESGRGGRILYLSFLQCS